MTNLSYSITQPKNSNIDLDFDITTQPSLKQILVLSNNIGAF